MKERATREIHGIVLAAAYSGWHSLLDRLAPRPLLLVAQQPLITYSLRWMKAGGLQSATICANSEARAVRTRLSAFTLGLRIDYSEDWSPRGPAGCVRDAGMRTDAKTFVVADGTTVPVADLTGLLEAHESSGATVTVVVGADAAGRLRPSGVYVFARRSLDFIPADGFQDIKEKLIPRLYETGEQVVTHMTSSVAPRVVNTSTYLALNQWALERTSFGTEPFNGFRALGQAVVHESATVAETARLIGPVLVGPRATILDGATVVGPASIGSGSTVRNKAIVSRSVVWSECVVGEGAFVDRCTLADGTGIEAGRAAYSEVKVLDPRGLPHGHLSRNSGKAIWNPIVAALRPTTLPHS